ncbi:MAG: hypothetical protein ACP5L5_08700 [Vulcanisaeta sp.]|uniref:hypothetical protein n=1 Tax=Vulcanisaeta sp. TaxID=2020871 RepID=UPI003D114F68
MLKSKFLILVAVDLETFSILPPHVLASRSIPVPTPLTLIGALLYPVMEDKYGVREPNPDDLYKEAYNIGIHYVTFRAAPYATVMTLERAMSITYQRRLKEMSTSIISKCIDVFAEIENYGLKATENKYGSNNECIKQYKEVIANAFAVASRGITVFNGTSYIAYIVNNEELVKYAWQIVRIGRKEDLVVVRDVKLVGLNELKLLGDVSFNSRFYVPKESIKGEPMNASLWQMPIYINGSVHEEDVYVPHGLFNSTIMVDTTKAITYEVTIDGMKEFIVIPREVIENA